jgi:hypothetical protein
MALVVQDATGEIANANGYISVDFFKEYHIERNVEAVVEDEFEDSEIAAAIILATDYMDTSRVYKSFKLAEDQTTEFPREDECIGFPVQVQRACAEYALRALSSPLAPDIARNAERIVSTMEKVGPLEERTSYLQTGSGSRMLLVYPAADMLLRKFVDSGAGSRVIR